MYKKLFYVFILSLLLNFIWERFHVVLYSGNHLKMVPWATLSDTVFIAVLARLFMCIDFLKKRIWLSFVIGVIAAVVVEILALNYGLWSYTKSMPLVPLVKTGLTPTVQLGVLAYSIFKFLNIRKTE